MKLKSNAPYGVPVEDGTVYTAKVNALCVTIHKLYDLDGWYLDCRKLDIKDRKLNSVDLFACVKESRKIIEAQLRKLVEDVDMFCHDEPIEITRY